MLLNPSSYCWFSVGQSCFVSLLHSASSSFFCRGTRCEKCCWCISQPFFFQLSPLCMQQLSPQSKPNLLSTIYSVPAIAPGIAALPQHPAAHKPAQCSQSKICSYSLLSLHGTASVIVVSSICTYTALSGHFWKFSIFFFIDLDFHFGPDSPDDYGTSGPT